MRGRQDAGRVLLLNPLPSCVLNPQVDSKISEIVPRCDRSADLGRHVSLSSDVDLRDLEIRICTSGISSLCGMQLLRFLGIRCA